MAKYARIRMTPEFLRQLLCLPLETEIHGSMLCHGEVEIVVEHPDLRDESRPGVEMPLITPTFRKQDPVVFVDWGQS